MTEMEWLACEDWRLMLGSLSKRLTLRQFKLYVCAGLHSLWGLLYDEASQAAVEIAEQEADGAAPVEVIRFAIWCAEAPTFGYDFDPDLVRRQKATESGYSASVLRLMDMGIYSESDLVLDQPLGDERTRLRLQNAAHIAYHNLAASGPDGLAEEHLLEHLAAEDEWPGGWLVREMVGNPFRCFKIDPSWLTPTVRALARSGYEDRALPSGHLDSERLAILADALEDAGCTDQDILGHLHHSGPHFRGCWVLDLVRPAWFSS
jgi:hypothetical protein